MFESKRLKHGLMSYPVIVENVEWKEERSKVEEECF